MTILKNLVLNDVGGTFVLISKDNSFPGLVKLNESGAFIFRQIEMGKEKEEIVSSLEKEYNLEREKAEASFEKFISGLVNAGFIVK